MRTKCTRFWLRFTRRTRRVVVVVGIVVGLLTSCIAPGCSWAVGGKKPIKQAEKEDKEKAREEKERERDVASTATKPTTTPAKIIPLKVPGPDNRVASRTSEKPTPIVNRLDSSHPLFPLVTEAKQSREAILAVKDYSAVLNKQELINGRLLSQSMSLKFRQQPFSVYMKFLTAHAGRELIYVEGQNKGQFLVHEAGIKSWVGTLTLLPTSKTAMAENRYPVTQIGMAKMLETVIQQWEVEAAYREVDVKIYPEVKVSGMTCRVLEAIHAKQRDYFPFHKTRVSIDQATKFPVRVEQYQWPAKEGGDPFLVEDYTYTQIKVNPGLTDRDFDKTNPEYKF